jgi:predicted nucleic acid-binding protein
MEKKLILLVDTCIFIDYLRGEDGVYDFITNDDTVDLAMSTISMMEFREPLKI